MSAQIAPKRTRSARAFTLVELLVVITIIGILVGLTIPAVMHVVVTGKQTSISMELGLMEERLMEYKEKFGEYPPDFAGVNLANPEGQAARDAVLRHIRKAFPRCTSVTDWASFEVATNLIAADLTPQTALVFWLGGMRDSVTGQPIGFSANPANPFDNTSTSRIKPFYDFDMNRLGGVVADNGHFYKYWPKEADNHSAGIGAIAYFRAENNGYYVSGTATVKSVLDAAGGATLYPAVDSRLPGPPWINDKSVQIFSAGLDKMYSDLTTTDTPLMFPSGSNYNPDPATGGGHTYDDITNFSGGTLEDAMP